MKLPEPRKILLAYLSASPKNAFQREMMSKHPKYSKIQWEKLAERLEQFTASTKQEMVLLIFPYVLKNIKQTLTQKTINDKIDHLWEKGFKESSFSKIQLEQMFTNWMLFEKELKELEKERSLENEIER